MISMDNKQSKQVIHYLIACILLPIIPNELVALIFLAKLFPLIHYPF